MGADPYWYFVAYQPDIDAALAELRQREFNAGRYNPVMEFLDFADPWLLTEAPGPGHPTIGEARAASQEDGTRSILDIERVGEHPEPGVASPLSESRLQALYATTQPTREEVNRNLDFLTDIPRGECRYFVIYAKGRPDEICFAGYSYD